MPGYLRILPQLPLLLLTSMYHLPPPKPLSFTGNVAQNFKIFEQSFDIYSCASGLDKKPKKTQASALLHVAGEEAIKVFNGFTWAEEGHKEDPKEIMKKFEEHCTPLTNVIYERHIFYGRIQHPDEAFDTFYSHLCNLVKTCEFDTLTDDMVRDRIFLRYTWWQPTTQIATWAKTHTQVCSWYVSGLGNFWTTIKGFRRRKIHTSGQNSKEARQNV